MAKNFIEYMKEEKSVNRIFIMRIGIIGAFTGAILATMFALLALL